MPILAPPSPPSFALSRVGASRAVARRRGGRVAALVVWDAGFMMTILAVTFDFDPTAEPTLGLHVALMAALAVVGPLAIALVGGYARPDAQVSRALLGTRLVLVAASCAWGGWLLAVELGSEPTLGPHLVGALVLLPSGWLLARAALGTSARRPRRALLVGTGPVAQKVAVLHRRHPRSGLEFVGCIDDRPLADADGPPVLGGLADIVPVVQALGVERVVVAFPAMSDGDMIELLRRCDGLGVDVDVVPRFFDLLGTEAHMRSVGGMSLVGVRGRAASAQAPRAKRAFDVVAAAMLLVLLAPLMVAIACTLLIAEGRPVLFRQTRVGLRGQTFAMYKFRTMTSLAGGGELSTPLALDPVGTHAGDAIDRLKVVSVRRVTRVGRVLRRTSLDELPQLFNVLAGSMSLVGPRPLPLYEAPAVRDWQHLRHEMRPGMTGLWQILGRSSLPWEERMQLDYSYVRHWTIASDLRILSRTLAAVVARRGAL